MARTKKARAPRGRLRKSTARRISRLARASGVSVPQREAAESPLKTMAAVFNIYMDRGRRRFLSTRQDLMQQARTRFRKFFR